MKYLACTIFFLIFCLTLTSCEHTKDKEKIENVWDTYLISLAERDGETAFDLLDRETIKYFELIGHYARFEDSANLQSRPIIEKIMILALRAYVPRDSLQRISGKDVIRFSVDHDLSGEVHSAKISNIIVDGDFAKALYSVEGAPSSFVIYFSKEKGKWKVCLFALMLRIMQPYEDYFQQQLQEQGLSENDFLENSIQAIGDDTLNNPLWQPLFRVSESIQSIE